MEGFIEHKIGVRIVNEGLFEDVNMLDENGVSGRGFVCAVDHRTDSGVFVPLWALAIKV